MSFKSKKVVSTSKPLRILHLDLFGPSRTRNLGDSYYGFVIIDDYSSLTWKISLNNKKEAFKAFDKFSKSVQNIFNLKILTLRSDHGGEFVNRQLEELT